MTGNLPNPKRTLIGSPITVFPHGTAPSLMEELDHLAVGIGHSADEKKHSFPRCLRNLNHSFSLEDACCPRQVNWLDGKGHSAPSTTSGSRLPFRPHRWESNRSIRVRTGGSESIVSLNYLPLSPSKTRPMSVRRREVTRDCYYVLTFHQFLLCSLFAPTLVHAT
jgi:hypothetical protein